MCASRSSSRSFFCASADLRRSELVVHRHGQLWEHIGTSMCLPVLAPPQVSGERLLIDGGLIDNLPVESMAELGEGPVIAVDIRAGGGPAPQATAPAGKSSTRRLRASPTAPHLDWGRRWAGCSCWRAATRPRPRVSTRTW